MSEALLWSTGAIIAGSMLFAYLRSRDPFHPLMYLGPMLLYIYVIIPGSLGYKGLLDPYFPDPQQMPFAQLVDLLSVSAFCLACLSMRVPGPVHRHLRVAFTVSPQLRRRLVRASYVLALVGIMSFVWSTMSAGGFVRMYSMPKGGAGAPSGYITSAPLLTILAIMFYLIAQRGTRLTGRTAAVVLFYASPHVVHAILSASRGTAFLAFATIAFGWYLAAAKRPAVGSAMAIVVAIGLLMLFLKSQRREIYIGSDFNFDMEEFKAAVVPQRADPGTTCVYSWGLILASHFHQKYFWGRRYAAHLFIRPIPKQIWPTKYEDMGLGWMVRMPGSGGIMPGEWLSALGWIPDAGSAAGFVADAFSEFAWGGVAVCAFLGLLYGYLWKRSILTKGLWTLIYFEACVVSVFIPTQGVATAWAYRFLYMAVPTILAWAWVMRYRRRAAARVPSAPPRPAPPPAETPPPPP